MEKESQMYNLGGYSGPTGMWIPITLFVGIAIVLGVAAYFGAL